MEIDIGNLVYIIFIAIIIIVNLFTKSKKKQGQPGQPNQEAEPTEGPVRRDARKSFEELLEEFTQPQKAEAPAPSPSSPPRPTPKPKPFAQPTYKAEPASEISIPARKNHSIMKTEYAKFEEFEEEEGEGSEYTDAFRDLDSAKKAFIYSEIFNKKY